MAGRAVVEPAEADLDLVREKFHELFDWPEVVLVRCRAESAGHAVLVAIDASVLGRDAHRARGLVEIDGERTELSVALVGATARDRLGGQRCGQKRGQGRERQGGAVHSIPIALRVERAYLDEKRLCAPQRHNSSYFGKAAKMDRRRLRLGDRSSRRASTTRVLGLSPVLRVESDRFGAGCNAPLT